MEILYNRNSLYDRLFEPYHPERDFLNGETIVVLGEHCPPTMALEAAIIESNLNESNPAVSSLGEIEDVIDVAEKTSLIELTVEASVVAKPFFERVGFVAKNENKVIRNGVVLINYSMTKKVKY